MRFLQSVFEQMKDRLVPPHPMGYTWIASAAGASLLLALTSDMLGLIGCFFTLYLLYAFRNPDRIVSVDTGVLVAPADGVIRAITEVVPPAALEMGTNPLVRVSIETGLFDVQVQRVPAAGKVVSSVQVAGGFAAVFSEAAAESNQRQLTAIATDEGATLGLVQIAGQAGRWLACDLISDAHVKRGEPCGLMRFGGRADIYLPKQAQVSVLIGQRTVAGETVLARYVVG